MPQMIQEAEEAGPSTDWEHMGTGREDVETSVHIDSQSITPGPNLGHLLEMQIPGPRPQIF